MSVTEVPGTDGDELWEALDDARTLLLLESGGPEADAACADLLSVVPSDDAYYLSVTYDESPDERVNVWRANVGEQPAETGVIAVGETSRSAAIGRPQGPGPAPVTVNPVGDPSDLTGLAMAIGAYLDAWDEADATPVVCFHSITSLLFHADVDRAFRFLHATTGRLRDIGAVAHYHLDPNAYQESTLNAFAALFDATVEVQADGSVTVRTRR